MKVTILNSYGENRIPGLVQRSIKNKFIEMREDVTYFDLTQLKISPCQACISCWVKTPGECIIEDDGLEVAKSYIQSDLVVLVTPVFFGCYSYELKRAMERSIPLLSPFFKKIDGEYHHKKRYEKYPDLIVIGILEERDHESEAIIFEQVERNSINFFSQNHTCILIYEHQCDEEIDEILACLFNDSWREKVWIEK